MSKPHIHANSSARKYGGKPEDYIAIHNLMDSSKSAMPDNRHRALCHNSWFIGAGGPLELIFGVTITNSAGRVVSAQDYLAEMEFKTWMNNGKEGCPPSHAKIEARKKTRVISLNDTDAD